MLVLSKELLIRNKRAIGRPQDLADLTELESMDVACAPFIEKAMELCNQKGASMVVRVIPDPRRDIGLQIMSIFHYRGDVKIVTCETLAQAKEILET